VLARQEIEMVQLAVADPVLRAGMIVRGPWFPERIISRLAQNALCEGNLVMYAAAAADRDRLVREIPALPAADPDAIATAAIIGSAVVAQTIEAAAFDGVIGRNRIAPCRPATITFDPSADWDTPSGECRVYFHGTGPLGELRTDSIAKPNGSGAGVYETTVCFSTITQVQIEACNGAAGTATVGISSNRSELSLRDYPGVALYRAMDVPDTVARQFAAGDDVEVLTSGVVGVTVEQPVAVGDEVWVRVLQVGANLRGQFTGQSGADAPATYARLAGAHYVRGAGALGVAHLRIGG